MTDRRPVRRVTRLLAFVCACCPLCAIRRHCPQSAFSRAMARIEKGCPFCRAARRVQAERR